VSSSTVLENTGAGTGAPPAVGTCSPEWAVLMGAYPVPQHETGLCIAGLEIAGPSGGTARPSVQTTARRDRIVVRFERTSSTPGDLPPEDPLS